MTFFSLTILSLLVISTFFKRTNKNRRIFQEERIMCSFGKRLARCFFFQISKTVFTAAPKNMTLLPELELNNNTKSNKEKTIYSKIAALVSDNVENRSIRYTSLVRPNNQEKSGNQEIRYLIRGFSQSEFQPQNI